MIGCGFRAVRRRLLEYGRASPMRQPLAGPFTFATAFCEEAKEDSPPAAAGAAEFRAQARPQPSKDTPACPTSLTDAQKATFGNFQRRSDKAGCEGRLRSTCGRNSSAFAAVGGDSFFLTPAEGRRELQLASQRP